MVVVGIAGYYIGKEINSKEMDESKKQAFNEMRLREDWQNKYARLQEKYGRNL